MSYSRIDGDYLYDVDVNMMAEGIAGNGVISGCAITASGSPDWHTHTAAGFMRVAGTVCVIAVADKTHDTPTSTNVRWDLLQSDDSANITIVKGTEVAAGGTPVKPNNTANNIIIAHVYVDGGVGNIPTANIFDARFMLPHETLLIRSSTTTDTINNGTKTFYTTTLTKAEASAKKILILVQAEGNTNTGSSTIKALNNVTQIGQLANVSGGQASAGLVVTAVAGTDYTQGSSWTLNIEGYASGLGANMTFNGIAVFADYYA